MKPYCLVPMLLASVIFFATVAGGYAYARAVESRYIHALAPQMFSLKNQGSALQTAAFQQSDLLPIYGSSELDIADPYHASTMFGKYPTGFTIFPVGKPGTTDLIMLQELAAIGPDLRGKKVVLSLSAPWFLNVMVKPDLYAGNFSRSHANELAYDTDLSFDVKQGAARRMLQYPGTLENDPLLKLTLQQLADGSTLSHAFYYALLPLGKLQTLVLQLQDHWQTVALIQKKCQSKNPLNPDVPRQAAVLAWSNLMEKASLQQRQHADNNPFGFDNQVWQRDLRQNIRYVPHSSSNTKFLEKLDRSAEWTDLNLLLRALKEMGARPLVLSMPFQGRYYDYIGVSQEARQVYYDKISQVAQRHGVPLLDFANHDEDKYFLIDSGAHVSREGWIYYDQALDAFYHGTLH